MNKIKIIHIVHSFEVGGIETSVLNLSNLIEKDKHKMHLPILDINSIKLTHNLDDNIILHLQDVDLKNNFLFLFAILRQTIKLLASIRPDIIHHLAIQLSRIKCLHFRTVHTSVTLLNSKNSISNKLKLLAEKLAIKIKKTYLISISNIVHKNNIFYFKNIAKDIKLIINGIDLNKYNKQNYTNISKEYFGFVKDYLLVSYVARLDQASKLIGHLLISQDEFRSERWRRYE